MDTVERWGHENEIGGKGNTNTQRGTCGNHVIYVDTQIVKAQFGINLVNLIEVARTQPSLFFLNCRSTIVSNNSLPTVPTLPYHPCATRVYQ